jgi:hypothetical protein
MTREEAIEVIEQDIPCEHDRDLIEALEIAISALSADVRPNIHGYWEDDREGFEHCHCSKCGQIIFSCQKWFKCCPRCMAVMDGEPKGEKGTE